MAEYEKRKIIEVAPVEKAKPISAQTFKTFSVDGHTWMRRLHLPYYWVARLREMRVGDELIIGCFSGPGIGSDSGTCSASFIREHKNKWFFEPIWFISIRSKQRPTKHIWTFGHFKLEKGGVITFIEDVEDTLRGAEKSFVRICRYISWVNRKLSTAEKRDALQSGHPPLWRGDLIRNGLNEKKILGPTIDPMETFIHSITNPI